MEEEKKQPEEKAKAKVQKLKKKKGEQNLGSRTKAQRKPYCKRP